MWAAGSASPATSACSAAVARSGVAPMFVSAIGVLTPPLSRRTTAATPTVAQSCARRVNLRYDQPVAAELRHADLGQHLLRPERPSRRRRGRSPPPRPSARRSGPAIDELGVEREHHRRQVGGGVAVGERAADRAAVAHLRVADQPGRVRDDRAVLLRRADRLEDRLVPRQRADREPIAVPRGRTRGRRAGRCRRAAPAGRSGASCSGISEWPPARSFASSREPSSSTACSTDSATS